MKWQRRLHLKLKQHPKIRKPHTSFPLSWTNISVSWKKRKSDKFCMINNMQNLSYIFFWWRTVHTPAIAWGAWTLPSDPVQSRRGERQARRRHSSVFLPQLLPISCCHCSLSNLLFSMRSSHFPCTWHILPTKSPLYFCAESVQYGAWAHVTLEMESDNVNTHVHIYVYTY